jgi:hypothetical protein
MPIVSLCFLYGLYAPNCRGPSRWLGVFLWRAEGPVQARGCNCADYHSSTPSRLLSRWLGERERQWIAHMQAHEGCRSHVQDVCCRALVSCRCAFVPPAAPSLRGLPQRPRKASVRACPHPVQRGRSACGHGAPAGLVPRAQCVARVTIRAVRVARQGVLPLSGCIHRCRCVTPSASTAQSSRSKVVPGGLKV